eukprot:scaffold287_cov337-Pavlova_lutheri.AAC.19
MASHVFASSEVPPWGMLTPIFRKTSLLFSFRSCTHTFTAGMHWVARNARTMASVICPPPMNPMLTSSVVSLDPSRAEDRTRWIACFLGAGYRTDDVQLGRTRRFRRCVPRVPFACAWTLPRVSVGTMAFFSRVRMVVPVATCMWLDRTRWIEHAFVSIFVRSTRRVGVVPVVGRKGWESQTRWVPWDSIHTTDVGVVLGNVDSQKKEA